MRGPLVMAPPQVNKFYAVDLAPEKSLLKWAWTRACRCSWSPGGIPPSNKPLGLEDYVAALDEAVDVARSITGSPEVNMWGSCSGGMTSQPTWAGSPPRANAKSRIPPGGVHPRYGSCADDSMLGLFTTPRAIRAAKTRSRRRGIVTARRWAHVRLAARERPDLELLGQQLSAGQPATGFRHPLLEQRHHAPSGQFHCDLLELFETNPYAKAGNMKIGGLPIDLRQVQVGAYVIGGITDHITPWRGCYGTARLFGPASTFVLANAGHLQSLINPPGASKSFFFAAPVEAENPTTGPRSRRPTAPRGAGGRIGAAGSRNGPASSSMRRRSWAEESTSRWAGTRPVRSRAVKSA